MIGLDWVLSQVAVKWVLDCVGGLVEGDNVDFDEVSEKIPCNLRGNFTCNPLIETKVVLDIYQTYVHTS